MPFGREIFDPDRLAAGAAIGGAVGRGLAGADPGSAIPDAFSRLGAVKRADERQSSKDQFYNSQQDLEAEKINQRKYSQLLQMISGMPPPLQIQLAQSLQQNAADGDPNAIETMNYFGGILPTLAQQQPAPEVFAAGGAVFERDPLTGQTRVFDPWMQLVERYTNRAAPSATSEEAAPEEGKESGSTRSLLPRVPGTGQEINLVRPREGGSPESGGEVATGFFDPVEEEQLEQQAKELADQSVHDKVRVLAEYQRTGDRRLGRILEMLGMISMKDRLQYETQPRSLTEDIKRSMFDVMGHNRAVNVRAPIRGPNDLTEEERRKIMENSRIFNSGSLPVGVVPR